MTASALDLQAIQTSLDSVASHFESRAATGTSLTATDLASGELARLVDRLLEQAKLPRLCGTDTVWKFLYVLDYQIPNGRTWISESLRAWMLGALWDELEAQERSVVSKISGLLVVIQQSCQETTPQTALIEQTSRAREKIRTFIRHYPSLLTFGVQNRLMEADDLEITRAFVEVFTESFHEVPDFVTQQSILETQSRLRGRGILEPLNALVQMGIQAARILDEGLSAFMETVNNDVRTNQSAQVAQQIETKIATLLAELNSGPRANIARLRGIAEQEVERYRPSLYLTLAQNGLIAPYLGGEIIRAEVRLDREISLLARRLEVRLEQAKSNRVLILENFKGVFDQLREKIELVLKQIEKTLQASRSNLERDPHREEYYTAEATRLEGEFRSARAGASQQTTLRNGLETRLSQLTSIQLGLLDRLLSQIHTIHDRVRAQTREVFSQLANVSLASEKQIAIVEFGDRDLTLSLISNLKGNLSYDAQVRIAATSDSELQSALLHTLGSALVDAARRYIHPDLLVSSFNEAEVVARLPL
ncbi:hypothetical protein CCP3SC1AL1_130032 [Gammaproteobacteria bacterium]